MRARRGVSARGAAFREKKSRNQGRGKFWEAAWKGGVGVGLLNLFFFRYGVELMESVHEAYARGDAGGEGAREKQPKTISHTRRWIFSCLAGGFRRCRRVRMADGEWRTCAHTPLPPSGRAASPLCCLLLLHGAVDSWRALSDDERGSRLFVCRES